MRGYGRTFSSGALRHLRGCAVPSRAVCAALLAGAVMIIVASTAIAFLTVPESGGVPAYAAQPESGGQDGERYTLRITFDATCDGKYTPTSKYDSEMTLTGGSMLFEIGIENNRIECEEDANLCGWDLNPNVSGTDCEFPLGSTVKKQFDFNGKTTLDITLYAIYSTERVIVFDPNGGSVIGAQVVLVPPGGKFVLPSAERAPDRTNAEGTGGYTLTSYEFDGWYVPSLKYSIKAGTEIPPWSSYISMVAEYTSSTDGTVHPYDVRFDAAGGACGTTALQGIVDLPDAVREQARTMHEDGYTDASFSFDGWYLDGERVGGAGERFIPTKDSDLTAAWIEDDRRVYTLTVDFDTGDGGTPVESVRGESSGAEVSVGIPDAVPELDGHRFLGWSTGKGDGASVEPGSIFKCAAGAITLYAEWERAMISVNGTPAAFVIAGCQWSYSPTVDVGTFELAVSGAPWISVSSNGVSGSTERVGTYRVSLTASDGVHLDGVQTFDLTVLSVLTFLSDPHGGVYERIDA